MSDKGIENQAIANELDKRGYALLPKLLSSAQCTELAAMYTDPAIRFRSRINMARYNFGQGEYQYFDYPLPALVQGLRESLYERLAPIANQWNALLGSAHSWPESLEKLTALCHRNGQRRPTPLLLKYACGDFNCLHQDLYGPVHFPLQVIIQLSKPDIDFEGGELLLVEQRPRMQSIGRVVRPEQGDGVVIPVSERPRQGSRGYHRAKMRHGVNEIAKGERHTLGIIFHDAE